jgi:hypothetical protein
MTTGILVLTKTPPGRPGASAVCLGDAAGDRAWFIGADGTIAALTWAEFHARFAVVGLFEGLWAYRFTSEERARADFAAGVFFAALACGAAFGVRVLTPEAPKPY